MGHAAHAAAIYTKYSREQRKFKSVKVVGCAVVYWAQVI
jgi:hypothetical protein